MNRYEGNNSLAETGTKLVDTIVHNKWAGKAIMYGSLPAILVSPFTPYVLEALVLSHAAFIIGGGVVAAQDRLPGKNIEIIGKDKTDRIGPYSSAARIGKGFEVYSISNTYGMNSPDIHEAVVVNQDGDMMYVALTRKNAIAKRLGNITADRASKTIALVSSPKVHIELPTGLLNDNGSNLADLLWALETNSGEKTDKTFMQDTIDQREIDSALVTLDAELYMQERGA